MKSKWYTFSVAFFMAIILQAQFSSQARILLIFGMPFSSHHGQFDVLTAELAKNGHEIFAITAKTKKHIPGNIKEIDLSVITESVSQKLKFANVRDLSGRSSDDVHSIIDMNMEVLEQQLASPEIVEFFKEGCKKKFDVIVEEYNNGAYTALGELCDAPLVIFTTSLGYAKQFELVGSPSNPILYPDLQSLSQYSARLSISEKIREVFRYIFSLDSFNYLVRRTDDSVEKHFGKRESSLADLGRFTALSLINCNYIFGGVRPLVPQMLFLGNMHFRKKAPLPTALQEFLDNAHEGVIYFSLGSTVLAKDLPKYIVDIFIDAFKELPFKVLWKWEGEELREKPQNVILSKWLPQQDLLGHPNVKVFITQGGLQSIEEGIQNKIPMIGIPIFADQFFNVLRMEYLGLGLQYSLKNLEKESLKKIIFDVNQNLTYKQNLGKISTLLLDQPMTSMQSAVWWVEYAARRGKQVLRSPAVEASIVDIFMIDVIAIVLSVSFICTYLAYAICKHTWRFAFKRRISMNIPKYFFFKSRRQEQKH